MYCALGLPEQALGWFPTTFGNGCTDVCALIRYLSRWTFGVAEGSPLVGNSYACFTCRCLSEQADIGGGPPSVLGMDMDN